MTKFVLLETDQIESLISLIEKSNAERIMSDVVFVYYINIILALQAGEEI